VVPLVTRAPALILYRDASGVLLGIVNAEQPALSLWIINRRENAFRFKGLTILIENGKVMDFDRGFCLQQLSPTLIQRQSGADLQPARPRSFTWRGGRYHIAVHHTPSMNRAVQQSPPFEQVFLLHAKRIWREQLTFVIVISKAGLTFQLGAASRLSCSLRSWIVHKRFSYH
jgi:hypothetical protein